MTARPPIHSASLESQPVWTSGAAADEHVLAVVRRLPGTSPKIACCRVGYRIELKDPVLSISHNVLLVDVQPAIGFSQRRSGKRLKPLSLEQRVRPCSIASAARCASGTVLDWLPATRSRPPRISRWRSPETGIHTPGTFSHSST